MRDLPPFTFAINQALPSLDSGWQAFPGHYLLYASSGTFSLEVATMRWLLPPQRAAWVRAAVPIRIQATKPITSRSILFAVDSIPAPSFDCRVFAVTPLARELIGYAMRWDRQRQADDPAAEQFFGVTAAVCLELADQADQFWLPRPESDLINQAMAYMLDHLADELTLEKIAAQVNVSSRTLARRFVEESRITCGQYIHHARLIRAMEKLAEPGTPVIDVALAVGFTSVSAFNAAFRKFTQETPSHYRKRFWPH